MMRSIVVFCLLIWATNAFSQFRLSGTVKDDRGQALIGANVVLEGSGKGTVTGTGGEFLLEDVSAGSVTLHISYIGFRDILKDIVVSASMKLEFFMEYAVILGDEVIVQGTRAGNNVPIASIMVTKEDIAERNLGQDLPVLLSLTPSFVSTSDAGAGVGYTNFRIRGTDANRINITMNGIPVNDAESHGVWWVNMPDFSSSIDNIQIQRGVGTSTNGSGAFGASINMQTSVLNKDPYALISSSAGTFNTFKNTLKVGTGLINDHFTIDARLSKIKSDGFIDRGWSDLKSFYTSAGYYGENTTVRINIFSGKEHTYQAWNGVPLVRLNSDTVGMQRYEDHWLYTREETQQMIESDARTYNYYTYENETDNYQQDHYQLLFSQDLAPGLNLNLALHYTYGRGYYEQYKHDQDMTDYGMAPAVTGSDTVYSTDLIRQKWLDNDFYGATFSMNFNKKFVDMTIGGAWNKYEGRHFGKVIWSRFMGEAEKDHEWYRSTGLKSDFTVYGKVMINFLSNLNGYLDLQYRHITHDINGIDDDLRDIAQSHNFSFFNPKLGLNYQLNPDNRLFGYFAIANREPNRSNYTDADPDKPLPIHETLYDFELGYSYSKENFQLDISGYYMVYDNQLILTGEINDVGAPVMTNVDDSYRMGVELQAGWQVIHALRWDLNTTFSRNIILNFTEYIDDWDNGGQVENYLSRTDIAFSPSVVGNSNIQFTPVKNLEIDLFSQYVGKQFIDNSSSDLRKLDAYLVNNLKIAYSLKSRLLESIDVYLLINNVFNTQYETNAWVYSYFYEQERWAMDGYFPQAGIHFLAGIQMSF